MNSYKKISASFASITTLLALAGCVSLLPPPAPAPKLVALSIPQENPAMQSNKSLSIEEPIASILYDSPKIILQKKEASGLVNYAYAQDLEWTERLPKLLQRALASHIKSPVFPAINSDSKITPNDYKLLSDIQKFHIQSPGAIEVMLNMSLVDMSQNRVIANQTFSYAIASEHSAKAYVNAFEKAMEQWGKDCVEFLQASME